ncbi:HNH endonuclease signature motif containing protein [Microbacterium thalassium]|uniref:HNH nuclease domain-containing protein n=1 Tax=Microbacterium thalassium TaxID=362649 RepID=A0A7X0FRL3_9MICO|nr:HNH endonuclease signature motif containing protein [Microbacterium thalassium]MBB6392420.1 hypothetical protein [Microbacterium thalassium]GLK25047.1 hypothetical protein GCM10017607_23650 [Microbacterium thalassium]
MNESAHGEPAENVPADVTYPDAVLAQPDEPWPDEPWPDEPWDVAWAPLLRDDDPDGPRFTPESNHGAAMRELEAAAFRARVAAADQWHVIDEVLSAARAEPELWVGPDPTLAPDWRDVRGRTVAAVRRDRRDLAVRAAAVDIAVRLQLSEATVQARAAHAAMLRERAPAVWARFLGGSVPEASATAVAQLVGTLPGDAPEAWAVFEERVLAAAMRLAPGRFRTVARRARERAHPETIDTRHRRAAADRSVWITPELDGMSTLTALLPAAAAHGLKRRIDHAARELRRAPDERRTLAQLRADVLADLVPAAATSGAAGASLAGTAEPAGASGPAGAPAATVAVTVPALTLLGEDDGPAILDGYGPIDIDTARRLAGTASSWVRILTDPVTGTVLDVDRRTYRVPADLKRWLGVKHPLCVFPGCPRAAADCDVDHVLDWQYGGPTADDNLAPLCRPHHRLKHESQWHLERDGRTLAWTSPTGHGVEVDPAPF